MLRPRLLDAPAGLPQTEESFKRAERPHSGPWARSPPPRTLGAGKAQKRPEKKGHRDRKSARNRRGRTRRQRRGARHQRTESSPTNILHPSDLPWLLPQIIPRAPAHYPTARSTFLLALTFLSPLRQQPPPGRTGLPPRIPGAQSRRLTIPAEVGQIHG